MNALNKKHEATSAASEPRTMGLKAWDGGIAIIGMSARFPQSRNVQEFWQHLVNGDSLISNFSEEELRQAGITRATLADISYVRRGNVIDDGDSMDAEFFGLSRREAEILDPQHRVFLECAWEALENAGRTGDGDRVGVFAGVGMNTYILQLLANPGVLANVGAYQVMIASDKDYLATRVAYKLNLRGPAVTVQTACSTSLAAVHLACGSLLNRECSLALAGGVSISFPQNVGYSYIPGMILSPDGYCRPFDAEAGGTVPGRGAGVVVLKRLSEAVADGDSIVAVIRGSAWNNDGAGKVGYTAPSIDGQVEVIRAAHASAGIDAAKIGYVEAHGTATELGDAIEFAALAQVFDADKHQRLLVLGAVKSNMGHADAAAGVAGLIKAALAVKSGVIPPTPTFARPNPALKIETTPFMVSSSPVDWTGDLDRWAGVSSFGIGGTNVHVVLSGAPALANRESETARPRIFPVSAKSASALTTAREQLSTWLSENSSASVDDVVTTLQLGRRPFEFRRAVVADSCAEAASLLSKPTKKIEPGARLGRDVAFLFPGQGTQFPGMVQSLYREDDAFRRVIDDGCEILQQHAGLDLRPFLVDGDKTPELSARFRETQIAQPALVLVEYALAERLQSLGVEPACLLGHSLGELTAACFAGVFSFEDGLRLAAERGRLMAQTEPGLMLAVMLPPEKLSPFLDSGLWLAAENGPKMSVASGLVNAVEELERKLAAEHVATVRLASKNAFHTPLMAEAAKAFRGVVAAVTRHAPTIPWLSNVSGNWIDPTEAQNPQYWANQILSPVRFTRCLATLAERRRLLLEVGPGEALIGIARQQLPKSVMVACLGAENRPGSDVTVFNQAVAQIWECGVSVDWQKLDPNTKGRRVALPTYPFERQRYWIESAPTVAEVSAAPKPSLQQSSPDDDSTAKREDIAQWFYSPNWRSTPPAGILSGTTKLSGCWLVFAEKDQLSDALVSALREQGLTVVCVKTGEQFSWQDGNVIVKPADLTDLASMWKRIDDSGLQPEGLIYLSQLNDKTVSPFETVLQLVQTGGARCRHLRKFEFITASMQSVSGEPVADSESSELFGLVRAIPFELIRAQCRCIDIELSNNDTQSLLNQLLDELSTTGTGLTVAYRRGTRWQKVWTPTPLQHGAESPFRVGGVYLITGGTGGIGHLMARHLLQHFDSQVVIVGRSTLPDRSQWRSWIASHEDDNSTSSRIRRMLDLESAGGKVHYIAADVTDSDAMRVAIGETQQKFGKLNGVIHAAGIPGGARILSQSIEEAREIRSAKVQGSRVLAEGLRGSNIDFLLFCSSISAVIPTPAQSAYAAGNAFQNSFAEYCRTVLNIPATAILFDAWRDVGMMADLVLPEGMESFYEEKMRCAMSNQEGVEVITRVLGQWPRPQILASTVNVDYLNNPAPANAVEQDALDAVATSSVVVGDLATIIDIWKDLLGTDAIEPSDNFFVLGGHSLMGTMMIARIRERLGVSLSLRHIFDAQTPEQLAELVRSASETAPPGNALENRVEDQDREVFEI